MEMATVKRMVLADIPDAQVAVEGEDCSFTLIVISDRFNGKSPVARQKMVMAPFRALLASGELLALSVKAVTPHEHDTALALKTKQGS